MGMEYQNQKGKEERQREKQLMMKRSRSSKFVGVRQRASGKWAAEIKDTSKKIRMWLGTFKTAEEAARAYDEAACLLRGSNTRTNFSSTHDATPTNSPISLKLRSLLENKAISNQCQSQTNVMSPTFQGAPNGSAIDHSIMVMEDNPACSSEGKSLFWVQNQAYDDDQYGVDMDMINCSMGVAPNALHFDYSWPLLPQQRINELPLTSKDVVNVERQLSASVYAMNECYVEDTFESKYDYDVNYPLSHLFCFT